jgi:hypothetical protein
VIKWIYEGEYLITDPVSELPQGQREKASDEMKASLYKRAAFDRLSIYLLADRLCVDKLAASAANGVYISYARLFARKWGAGEVLEGVVSQTQASDGLRKMLLESVRREKDKAVQDDVLMSAIEEHEPGIWEQFKSVYNLKDSIDDSS